jgi:transcriptional regulator with XRE-family HTH domain
MLLAEARTELSEELLLDGASTLRTMRLQKGLSQTKLAAMLGTSQSHVARIERGTENVSIQTCRKLREALGVDMNALNEALLRQEAAYDKRASQR